MSGMKGEQSQAHDEASADTDNRSGFRSRHPAPVQDAIGAALQSHFNALAAEPLPDSMLALLAQLEAKERDHGQS